MYIQLLQDKRKKVKKQALKFMYPIHINFPRLKRR